MDVPEVNKAGTAILRILEQWHDELNLEAATAIAHHANEAAKAANGDVHVQIATSAIRSIADAICLAQTRVNTGADWARSELVKHARCLECWVPTGPGADAKDKPSPPGATRNSSAKLKQQEDWRTLREFYPDPKLRHMVHYAFAHKFLPQYVRQNPSAFFSYLYDRGPGEGPTDPTRFIHSRWHAIFEPGAGLVGQDTLDIFAPGKTIHVFRRVKDLTMSLQTVAGSRAALIQMPPPEQSPQACFVCVVEYGPRIFTLEAEQTANSAAARRGVICEWTKENKHHNFGLAAPADGSAFLQALELLLKSPNAHARAGFTPPKVDGLGTVTMYGQVGQPQPQEKSEARKKKPWWNIW